MEDYSNYQIVIDKIKNNEHFGLFDDGQKCYFQDGTKVSYTDLWLALRAVHNLTGGMHNKTLTDLCPITFEGTYKYRYARHKWKK